MQSSQHRLQNVPTVQPWHSVRRRLHRDALGQRDNDAKQSRRSFPALGESSPESAQLSVIGSYLTRIRAKNDLLDSLLIFVNKQPNGWLDTRQKFVVLLRDSREILISDDELAAIGAPRRPAPLSERQRLTSAKRLDDFAPLSSGGIDTELRALCHDVLNNDLGRTFVNHLVKQLLELTHPGLGEGA